jgi:hypothetical protein
MFEEFAKKTRVVDHLKRYLLVIPAVLAFCLVLVLFALVASLRSGKEGREARRLAESRKVLLDSVRMAVVESGFLRRKVGTSDVYVPMVRVQISNVSTSTIENLEVMCYFESESVFSCQSYARIFRLGPGEITEASLRCIEPTGFGTVITGISLPQTTHPVNFSIQVHHQDAYATFERGTSTFRLLGPAPPVAIK